MVPFSCDGVIVVAQGGPGTADVATDTGNDTPRTSMPRRANHRGNHSTYGSRAMQETLQRSQLPGLSDSVTETCVVDTWLLRQCRALG